MNLSGNTDLIIASGRDYADALSASSTGAAVMLAGNELTNEQLEFIKNVSEDVKIYIAGGTSAVSEYIESQLEKNGIEIADRFDGANRYETSVRIAEVFFKKPEAVYIVSGDDFPDGITGGVLANADNAPLILVNVYAALQTIPQDQYEAAQERVKDIAKRLIQLEEQLAVDLRDFL